MHWLARTAVRIEEDAGLAGGVRALGIEPVVTNTVMRGAAEKKALAEATLAALGC